MAAITLAQMLKRPMVLGVFSRVKETGTFFQRFFGISPQSAETENFGFNTTGVYEIFDHSATLAQPRAAKVGPAKVSKKPIGQAMATVLRFYEAITLEYEDIFGTRGIGQNYDSPLEERGQTYVAKQMMYMAERQANAMEFMISRMFRGGFSITLPASGASADSYSLGELGASGAIDITFPIPAVNKNQIDAGTGSGLITATWATAGTAILSHMLSINKAAERQTGYPIKHCFLNTTTYTYMLANTQLQTVRGTAMRAFEQFREQLISTTGAERQSGFSVVFPSMPQFTWHIYDGVSVVATQTDPDPRTTSNTSLFIPDNVVIMTPEPGDWMGKATRDEPIKETDDGAVVIKSGLDSWSYGTNDPPGEEVRFLNNFVPVLYVPRAVYYATVIGF